MAAAQNPSREMGPARSCLQTRGLSEGCVCTSGVTRVIFPLGQGQGEEEEVTWADKLWAPRTPASTPVTPCTPAQGPPEPPSPPRPQSLTQGPTPLGSSPRSVGSLNDLHVAKLKVSSQASSHCLLDIRHGQWLPPPSETLRVASRTQCPLSFPFSPARASQAP